MALFVQVTGRVQEYSGHVTTDVFTGQRWALGTRVQVSAKAKWRQWAREYRYMHMPGAVDI